MGVNNQNVANVEFKVTGHVEAQIQITDERFTLQQVIQALNDNTAACDVFDDGNVYMLCEGEQIPVGTVVYADRYFKYSDAQEF